MSLMRTEAAEAPEAVARFLDMNRNALEELGQRLRQSEPALTITCARGSSDHAATYFQYLSEIVLGLPCASVGASIVSVYGAKLRIKQGLCLTISQSGKSPDIVALQQAARSAGALTVALVNDATSPAARDADISLPLYAGPEKSVAATKSLIVSLVAGAALVSHWSGNQKLIAKLNELPEKLLAATKLEWQPVTDMASTAQSLYVLGRGPAFPIAQETALKLKEVCAIHAEAYSVAEVMHGPLELLAKDFPILAYAPDDQSRNYTSEAIAKMRRAGANVVVAGVDGLPTIATGEPLFDPITMIQTAYFAIEQAATNRNRNPDQPRLLQKVTETH